MGWALGGGLRRQLQVAVRVVRGSKWCPPQQSLSAGPHRPASLRPLRCLSAEGQPPHPHPVFAGCYMGGEVTLLFLRFGVVVLPYFRIQWFIITMKKQMLS